MNTKLIIHIVISLISLSGLIVYYYAFLLGYKKHNSQLKKQSKLPEKLYFMSTYPALIWYVLPFIEQPRMHGIYDWLNGEFGNYISNIHRNTCIISISCSENMDGQE